MNDIERLVNCSCRNPSTDFSGSFGTQNRWSYGANHSVKFCTKLQSFRQDQRSRKTKVYNSFLFRILFIKNNSLNSPLRNIFFSSQLDSLEFTSFLLLKSLKFLFTYIANLLPDLELDRLTINVNCDEIEVDLLKTRTFFSLFEIEAGYSRVHPTFVFWLLKRSSSISGSSLEIPRGG